MELEPRTHAPAHATGAVEFVPLSAIDDDATFRLREEGDVSALAASLGRLGQLVPLELRPRPGSSAAAPRFQVVSGFRRIAALRLLRRERALARVHVSFSDEDGWGLALSQALLTEPLDRASVEALRARLEPAGVAPWAMELLDEALVRAPVEPELREQFFEFLGAPEAAGEDPLAPGLPEGAGPLAPSRRRRALPADGARAKPEQFSKGETLDGYAAELAPSSSGQEDAMADESLGPDGAGAEADEEPAPEASAGVEADSEGASGEEVEMTPEELAADLARRMYEVNADLAVAWEAWADIPPEGRAAIADQARWIAELLPSLERELEE